MKTELEGKLELMEHRLARLERQNRRWMALAVLSTVALVMTVALGAAASNTVPDVIQARRIEIVDAKGKARITLSAKADGKAAIRIFDASGKEAIKAYSDPFSGSAVQFLYNNYYEVLRIGVGITGTPHLIFVDGNQKLRASLALADNLAPTLSLYGPDQKLGIALGFSRDGVRNLAIYDRAEQQRVWLGVGSDGSPSLLLKDNGGRTTYEAPPSK